MEKGEYDFITIIHKDMNILQVRNLKKKYGKQIVLNDISFQLQRGDVLGYIGPNGSGKTTTIKIICDLIKKDDGEITIYSREGQKQNIGVVFEGLGLYKRLTAWENLEFAAKLAGYNENVYKNMILNLLDQVNLLDVRDKIVKNFSKGMAKRLSIILAVLHDPTLLILDEPFDGIDTKSHHDLINFLKEWVKEKERAILFTSHDMADVDALCNKIAIIDKGKIVEYSDKASISIQDELPNIFISLYYPLEDKILKDIKDQYNNLHIINTSLIEVSHHTPAMINKLALDLINQQQFIKEIYFDKKSLEDIYLHKIGGNDK
ncbi:ABC transporter ATP-binding protein [Herbinix luporum]|uniref:ABC transporter domain-containing protein n=1 Tax=Herbinix luporum TaxID=1679721 RepID=A0A0K8J3K9_9FIRM|nr:ABC transporter ATP-binding protein [Herbinix luporum]CUH92206.1 hypothetical protein SD1D_0658 [Herbinix luporum]